MEMRDKADVLLNMAKAMMNAPQDIAPAFEEIGVEALKSRWFDFEDRAISNIPADSAQDGDGNVELPNSLSTQSQAFETDVLTAVENSGTELEQPVVKDDPDLESEPELDAVALQKEGPVDATAKRAVKLPGSDEPKSPNSAGKDPQFGLETSKPLEPVKSATVPLPSNSIPDDLNSNSDDRPLDNGDDLDGQSLQKPALPSGGSQGLLSRLEAKSGQGVVPATGEKEIVPQDKALQSDVIRQIVQRMALHTQGGQSKMVIHLKPEYLGNVHMQVLTENHQVTVRMMADSIGVKEIVEQNLQHLRAEMQHHGLEIQKFDVFVANDNGGWKSGQEQAGFRESLRQRKQRFDGGKDKVSGAKSISDVGLRKTDSQKNLNEIDYFA
jgi:flagellar hook-length control protein FliK